MCSTGEDFVCTCSSTEKRKKQIGNNLEKGNFVNDSVIKPSEQCQYNTSVYRESVENTVDNCVNKNVENFVNKSVAKSVVNTSTAGKTNQESTLQ